MSSQTPSERQRRVARALRDGGPMAPPALRARIEAQVASLPERRRAAPRRMALVGVLAAAFATVGIVLAASGGGDLTIEEAADVAIRDVTSPAPRPEPAQPHLLTARFEGVDYPNWEPAFGWKAVGQRSDHVGGRDAHTVFYEHQGHHVGYTVVSGPPLDPPRDATRMSRRGLTVHLYRDGDGRDVAVFERRGRTCIVSGHVISSSTLVKLAAWNGGGVT